MPQDAIIQEIRKYLDEYAKQFNYDIKAMGDDLRRRQAQSGRKLVKRSPKPAQKFEPVTR
jgi:hypothetical protein